MVVLDNDAVSASRRDLLALSLALRFEGGLFSLLIHPPIRVVPLGAHEDVSKVERPGDGVSHHEEV